MVRTKNNKADIESVTLKHKINFKIVTEKRLGILTSPIPVFHGQDFVSENTRMGHCRHALILSLQSR